jgi:hypothetical protein
MNKKNLAGALIASLSLPLMLITFGAPLANAANVSSTVATVDNCKWVMANVPSAIAMSTSATYGGDALSVSTVIEAPTLGLSGTASTVATQDSSTECSFYNSVINASVSAEITTTSFVAYYGDNADNSSNTADGTMNFEIGAGAPLDMTFSVAGCATANIGWTGSSAQFTAADTLTLFQFESGTDEYAAGAAPICHPETTVELTIPTRTTVPLGAGERYSWDGPTITFSSTPSS